jgi:hypothetical protein
MPTIVKYPIEDLVNTTASNKLVALMQLVSDPFPATADFYDYLPGLLIVLVIYIVIFLSLKLRGASFLSAFASTNVVNFILVLLMFPLGIISGQVLVISLFLMPISAILLWAWN